MSACRAVPRYGPPIWVLTRDLASVYRLLNEHSYEK
jgi:hypothetical protein